jgi:hypothetical protein
MQTHSHTCALSYTLTHSHTHVNTLTHICTLTHTHSHTHVHTKTLKALTWQGDTMITKVLRLLITKALDLVLVLGLQFWHMLEKVDVIRTF